MAYVPSTIITAPVATDPGNFTPGAAWSMSMIASILNATWNQAGKQEYDYNALINSIIDEANGWLSTQAAPKIASQTAVAAPTVVEPAVTIPTKIDISTLLTDYRTEYSTLMNEMVTAFTNFKTAHFGSDETLYAAGEAWVAAALANPGGGLPATVVAQITSDDHARISDEANVAIDTLRQSFAALRFPLPPGAMAAAELQIHQREQDLMAESSRKLTVLSIDNMKYALDHMLKMRNEAMNDTINWIKTLVLSPEVSSKVIGLGLDAQPKLIGSVSDLLRSRTEVQKMISSVEQFNVSTALQVADKNQAADLTMIENRLKALLTHCQSLAQQITASLNNMHVSGGSAYNVNGT